MKSKSVKRREAIQRMENTMNVPQTDKKGAPKDDTLRRKRLQSAIDNTKTALGATYEG